ncbi:MAG: hypothetical protein MUC88_00080 [Planctomycetes bacterium]|jgi:hypothetical protein|nr:hypothetical protein [Planctomycetota bacterium]
MSAMYIRGGIPRFLAGGADATAWSRFEFPDGPCNSLVFKNTGANPLLLALSKEDADAGVGWTVGNGVTVGPWPAESATIWVKATVSTTTWEALAFIRRG